LPISADSPIKFGSPNDTGKAVLAILHHPEETNGKIVELFSGLLCPAEMLASWSKVIEKPTKYEKVTPEAYIAQNVAIYSPQLGVDLATKFATGFSQHMCYFEDLAKKVGNWNTNYVQAHEVSIVILACPPENFTEYSELVLY
jgi:hypothetical protein